MRLLIAEDKSRSSNLEEFGKALTKMGINCEIVSDIGIFKNENYVQKYSKIIKIPNRFKKLIDDFKPDVIMVERISQFALLSIKSKIPVVFFMLGDFWSEMRFAKENCTSVKQKIKLSIKNRMAKQCFEKSEIILPICNYLEDKVKKQYPNKKTSVMYQGIEIENWHSKKGMDLKHPCVGLLQGATIWGKTKEMLILKDVIQSMPDVTFYWAGDGPYREKITSQLEKYENFKWIGTLEYPDKVQEFLTEIDVYALVSGQDMSPHTLLEAGLMKKPVIATDVGGVSESILNNNSGYLVNQGKSDEIIQYVSQILNDKDKANQMGEKGYQFVKDNFSWEHIAKKFIKVMENKLE